MTDLPRSPSKLRLVRPYATEDEFVAGDAQWFGRGSITLVDVGPRPIGELVRFEVVLANGAPVLRGEGHVVAHQPARATRPPGLEVRFARIDARSKLVLDRVRALRATGSREALSMSPPSSRASVPPSSLPSMPPASIAPPSVASSSVSVVAGSSSFSPASTPADRSPAPPVDRPSDHSGVHMSRAARGVPAPPNREEILARLRERAGRLEAQGTGFFKRRDVG